MQNNTENSGQVITDILHQYYVNEAKMQQGDHLKTASRGQSRHRQPKLSSWKRAFKLQCTF